jgi:diadenosine tetraphosphatase ApaH/serine/threonine PP2A family protein phosphatase
MRLAFVSDMHGNWAAFEAVLAELDRRGPFDAVYGGGDFAFNGLYPGECVQAVIDRGWESVRGNTDEWLVEAATDGATPAQNVPPGMEHTGEMKERDQWAAERMSTEQIDFLKGLPLSIEVEGPSGQSLTIVHATPWSAHPPVWADAEESEKREMIDRAGTDALVYGHVHHAYQQEIDGKTIACAGAVGSPFDGDPRACFAIVTDDGDGWRFEHVRVDYDSEGYARELEASDIPGAADTARSIRTGTR